MKKVIAHAIAFATAVLCVPATVTHADKKGVFSFDYRHDPRVIRLTHFFKKGDCPAADLSRTFLEEADAHELDWRLLPSLSMVESTGGKAARNNNLFGWNSGRAEFASLSEGIHK